MANGGRISEWNLSRRLGVALAALSFVLILAGVALVVVVHQADVALSEQTERTFPARLAGSQLLTALVDQQTGLRGFALTGDDRYLEPYRRGIVDEQDARAQLDRYVPPGNRARLAMLTVDAAITAWRDQFASLHTTTGDPSGGPTFEFGSQLFERVRATSRALDAQLARQAATNQKRAQRDRQLVVVVLATMALAVAGAVVGLQQALQRTVLRPMRRLGIQVGTVSQGAHDTPIRVDGPPDMRAMGEGVESMRGELVRALAEIEDQRRGLERRAAELARSNADLEQFAYVASHDLQEPLRKVASFCQLLEQRYGDQLDDRAHQYIEFAVDGARRMQLLITDLLTFSRVGRTNEDFVAVDLAESLTKAWTGLDAQVHATNGELQFALDAAAHHVRGAPSLLQLLLTNVLGNALKYRRDDASPVVHVSASVEGPLVRVNIADNGIGIPDEYAEKVFVIFQRLHAREAYDGTGIGLALAKKIVEYHGGTISLLPSPLGGACVSFTLPMAEIPVHV